MKTILLLFIAGLCLFSNAGCNQRASSGVDGGRTYPELSPGGRLRPERTTGGR